MNPKIWIAIVAAIVIIGGGAWAISSQNKNSSKNNSMMAGDEKMMAKDTMTMENNRMAMSDEKVLGVYMKDGKLLTIWPGNELMTLQNDLTLKSGAKVMVSGKIMAADGSTITLSEGQVLNTDGSITGANKELMSAKVMMTNDAMMGDEKMKMEDITPKTDEMMKAEAVKKANTEHDAMMMAKVGSYKDYSPETVAAEQKAGNKVVLFFHATWCPYCKAADAAFKASPEKIPSGVTVLKTDYDSNTSLKTKYGVTTQHTFVQIDTNGNMITKWVSGDIDMLIKNIK
jgi:thiol-disulfide isomerase/thioredoxin